MGEKSRFLTASICGRLLQLEKKLHQNEFDCQQNRLGLWSMHFFEGFKNFRRAKIDLFSPVTILIGPNGSGKSNAIEAVELLGFLSQGRYLHEITDVGRGGALEVRGGLQRCPRSGTTEFTLGIEASVLFEESNRNFHYEVTIRAEPEPRVAGEKLVFDYNTPDPQLIFQSTDQGGTVSADILVQYNNFKRGGTKPTESVPANRSILAQYDAFASKNSKFEACSKAVAALKKHLRLAFVFDPIPRHMRAYDRIGNRVLSRDGANLSATLYDLSAGDETKKQILRQLLDWIRQLPGEPYEDFGFVRTELNDVIFGLKQGGNLFDARSLSDGTLRTLSVLTALQTVDSNSRVIIEEFDNGLHPSRSKILVEALFSSAEQHRTNILVSTHNPATLNALKEDQLKGVVFTFWNTQSQSSTLCYLKDLPRYPALLDQGGLGDLMTRQLIEQWADNQAENDSKKKALEWLKAL